MKVLIGGDDELDIKEAADSYYRQQERTDSSSFFKKPEYKIMGLKDLDKPFPNGMRIVVTQEGHKSFFHVKSVSARLRTYEINNRTGVVRLDNRECTVEELEQLMKLVQYMQEQCNEDNSQTVTLQTAERSE